MCVRASVYVCVHCYIVIACLKMGINVVYCMGSFSLKTKRMAPMFIRNLLKRENHTYIPFFSPEVLSFIPIFITTPGRGKDRSRKDLSFRVPNAPCMRLLNSSRGLVGKAEGYHLGYYQISIIP